MAAAALPVAFGASHVALFTELAWPRLRYYIINFISHLSLLLFFPYINWEMVNLGMSML